MRKKLKPWQRQHRLFVALLLGIFCLAGVLAVRYDRAWDLTFNQRNQLSETSVALVKQLQAPVKITAFSRGNPKVNRLISRLLRRYQRHGDFSWTFKNPDAELDAVRRYGIQHDGELLLHYQGQILRIDTLNETAISRGLYRLLQGKTRRAVFVAGHGEHNFKPDNPSGYAALKQRLQAADIEALSLDLNVSQRVPDDCDVLVLAAPKFDLSDSEVAAIDDYLKRGGRLLWLAGQAQSSQTPNGQALDSQNATKPTADNQPTGQNAHQQNSQQAALGRLLGLRFVDGLLVGVDGKAYGLNDGTYVPVIPTAKQPSPLLAGIDTMVVFPSASPIQRLPTDAAKRWQVQSVLSPTGKWFLRTGKHIQDAPAPILLAVSLVPADVRQSGQVVLMSDADFATDRFIGLGQNGDFAVNMVRQLAAPDVGHIVIANEMPPPVVLSKDTMAYLALALLVGTSLLILLTGFWSRRRGAR